MGALKSSPVTSENINTHLPNDRIIFFCDCWRRYNKVPPYDFLPIVLDRTKRLLIKLRQL